MLEHDEPAAFEVINEEGQSPYVLTCDHASCRLPRALGNLGLSDAQLTEHIAWDIGALEVAKSLAGSLDAPLIASGYSRLAIDCNRPLDSSASIPEITGGVPVPGNVSLTTRERGDRQESLFWPYHRAIERVLREREARRQPSVIFAIHSFTPVMNGKERPWEVSMLYGKDRRLAALFLESLGREPGLVVGDNEPYFVTDESDYGIPVYAERPGRLGVAIELRQDLLSEPSSLERMTSIVFSAAEHARRTLFSA